MARICITHYQHLESYSKSKEISVANEIRIKNSVVLREQLLGRNHHEEQCNSIPKIIDRSKYAIHPECYKRFTLILSTHGNCSWKHKNIY